MTSAEDQLAHWRREIAAELEQFEAELFTARGEVITAERQVEQAKGAYEALALTCTRGLTRFSDGLAGPVWARLQEARRAMLDEISRIRGGLPARVRALEELIAGRRLALAQLDRALSASTDNATPVRLAPVPRRQRPPPVEFDVITPGGAA